MHLVTGDITVNVGNDTYVAFKNCVPCSTYKTEINDAFLIRQTIFTLPCLCKI